MRPFRADEWAVAKDVRLRGLKTDPLSFGSHYAKEIDYDDARWQARLADPTGVIFGVFDGDTCIGATGVHLWKEDPSGRTALLWGSWLQPDYRGRGLSVLMYQARLAWARAHPTVEKIVVSHRESNHASRAANQKHGFIFTHQQDHLWHDGVTEPEVFYALPVKG